MAIDDGQLDDGVQHLQCLVVRDVFLRLRWKDIAELQVGGVVGHGCLRVHAMSVQAPPTAWIR